MVTWRSIFRLDLYITKKKKNILEMFDEDQAKTVTESSQTVDVCDE